MQKAEQLNTKQMRVRQTARVSELLYKLVCGRRTQLKGAVGGTAKGLC